MPNVPIDGDIPEALLRSARAAFRAHGFAAANVGSIAAAAGMSKKTIYKYVSSKEALLVAVMRSVANEAGLSNAIVDPAIPPATYLTAFAKAFAEMAFSEEGVTSYRFMMSEGTRLPEVARIYIETVRRLAVKPLADQLAAYAATGQMHIPDTTRSAKMLLSMLVSDALRDAALGLEPPPTGADLEDLLADVTRIFLRGVLSNSVTREASQPSLGRDPH